MGITRNVEDLIDADVATYNKNYNQRILKIIKDYGHIIRENGEKEFISDAQKELLDCYEMKLMTEQENFLMTDDEYKKLQAEVEPLIKKFDTSPLTSEEQSRKTNVRLGNFVYFYVEYMEKIFPKLLRKVYWSANEVLRKELREHAFSYNGYYIGVGSNRQTYGHDDLNKHERGTTSIYTELNALAISLGFGLDKFTLADLHENKAVSGGYNYKKILAGGKPATENIFDDSKVNIIYAFGHRMAVRYSKIKNCENTLNLWDDHEGILKKLKTFYSARPELLPKGLTLNLIRYEGEIKRIEKIIGAGPIDYNYKENTVLMETMCPHLRSNAVNIADSLNVDEFLQKRITILEKDAQIVSVGLYKPKKTPSPAPISIQQTATLSTGANK